MCLVRIRELRSCGCGGMTTLAEPDWTRRTSPVEAGELRVLGAIGNPGAMGTVYQVAGQPSCLYKRYTNPSMHAARLDRLITWRHSLSGEAREFLDSRCAWPLVTVTESGRTAGFLMRSAPDAFWAEMAGELHTLELQHLIHTAAAKEFGIELPGPEQRLALVESLADTLAFLEAHEFVYGDVNERNVLWTLADRPQVFLIDCDNARPADLPAASAGVAMPRNASWRDPDLPDGGYPDINSDRYTLAVFCYRVFYEYYLPTGTAKASLDDDRNKVLLPEEAPHLPGLERALTYGLGRPQTRPSGAEWMTVIKDVDLSAPKRDSTIAFAIPPSWQDDQRRAAYPGRRGRVSRGRAPAATAILLAATAIAIAAVALITIVVMNVFAAPASLSQYLALWQAGPVKIAVPHYFSHEERAAKLVSGSWKPANANWTDVGLRASVRNLTSQPLDLASANTHLVLVIDEPFPRGATVLVGPKPVVGVPSRLHLYYVGFYDATFNVEDKKKNVHVSGWTGQSVSAGETFDPPSSQNNSAIYILPSTVHKLLSNYVSVSPAKLHVLGVAWLGADDNIQGFTPVSAWQGQNSLTSFLAG
jgi:hypothetical protein